MNEETTIVLSARAGQGLRTLEELLLRMFKRGGYHVYSYSEVMSRVRGGNNTTLIRVSSHPVCAFRERIDLCVPLSPGALDRLQERISHDTVIIGERDFIPVRYHDGGYPFVDVPLGALAIEAGGRLSLNTVVLGLFGGLFDVDQAILEELVEQVFGHGDEVLRINRVAARKGHALGRDLHAAGQVSCKVDPGAPGRSPVLVNGAQAVGIGVLAGGCSFVAAYPMSPSTGVLVFLAKQAREFGLVVEQAEDEIAAVNMAVGSWYAGARGFVTTSGGGFALMTEGLSLAAALETPVVVHVGQRPGPATGLPTRTEQADLEFVLHAGHGEWCRVIYAPGSPEEATQLTARAFTVADRFQVPVLILTDQYLLDAHVCLDDLELPAQPEFYVSRTGADYRRYALGDASGLSARGIPGYGEGLVCVDSDEHDELGRITEDTQVRTHMVRKRLARQQELENDAVAPTVWGTDECRHLIVCWGSTGPVLAEALREAQRNDCAIMHFSQVWPLSPQARRKLEQCRRRIIVENNATGQLGRLLRREWGVDFEDAWLKYDGMPFSVEHLATKIKQLD